MIGCVWEIAGRRAPGLNPGPVDGAAPIDQDAHIRVNSRPGARTGSRKLFRPGWPPYAAGSHGVESTENGP